MPLTGIWLKGRGCIVGELSIISAMWNLGMTIDKLLCFLVTRTVKSLVGGWYHECDIMSVDILLGRPSNENMTALSSKNYASEISW